MKSKEKNIKKTFKRLIVILIHIYILKQIIVITYSKPYYNLPSVLCQNKKLYYE